MEIHHALMNGTLWFGRHSADGDTLVLDPERATRSTSTISFFSLTQFRPRGFPAQIVADQIHEIVDPEQRALAEEQYKSWPALKAQRDQASDRAETDAAVRLREHIIEKHRLFVEAHGVAYQGIQDSGSAVPKGSRRQRNYCHECGIPLDDFVASRCLGCHIVLCSCGGCGCGGSKKPS